jgi:hypothetical protein
MRLQPECAGNCQRIYFGVLPPRFFIAATMNLTVVRATQRHRELVADLATKCIALRKAQMVRIRWPHKADTVAWTWSRSRMRRCSGNASTALSIGDVLDSLLDVLASPVSACCGDMLASLVVNACSTCWASAADNLFLGHDRLPIWHPPASKP